MTPYYEDDAVTLYAGDCLDVLATLPDNSVDAVVTDPPYGLEFMGREWDAPWQASVGIGGHNATFSPGAPAVPGKRGEIKSLPSYTGTTNPTCRNCGGTRNGNDRMSRRRCSCDRPDFPNVTLPRMIAFGAWCEQWAVECLRVLKPGGHLLAFGGTRTYHRLTCGIEDAGFEIRDEIAWLYGSGFPKSLDVSKAIDKRPGVTRHAEFAADLRAAMAAKGYTNTFDVSEAVTGRRTGAVANWQKYQWPDAKWWPALRDLLDLDEATWGPVIAEAARAATGIHAAGLATGEAGVGGAGIGKERRDVASTDAARTWQGWGTALKPAHEPIVVARKPLAGTVAANVLAHGTGALNIDGCRVASEPDRASGWSKSGSKAGPNSSMSGANYERAPKPDDAAGRWPSNVLLDGNAADELDRQSGTLTSGANPTRRGSDKFRDAYGEFTGQEECTPARGADSGGASRFFPTFRYEAKAPTVERPRDGAVAHPTVKPLDLMRWLVRLVTPPGGTVLEPFAGSGTTAEACVIEGFRCIAIEREPDYLPLIVARLTKPIQTDLFGGVA